MNILDRIVKQKKKEVADLKNNYKYSDFAALDLFKSETLSLSAALRSNGKISIIAEIKKASPSKGLIKPDFNHLEIAEIYQAAEVDAISVLTDKTFFQGDITFLKQIALHKKQPLLRKDFIIDEYQILEARANGADAVLLIAEILSPEEIRDFTQSILDLGMEPLLELHSARQLDKIDLGYNQIIGINNRDLSNFTVDLATTKKISGLLPDHITLVAESGIDQQQDLDFLKQCKIDAILIGEHLMRASDIGASIVEVKGWCSHAG